MKRHEKLSGEHATGKLTGDDIGTIVGICVELLIISAGLGTSVLFGLLFLLARASVPLWSHSSPLR